VKDIIDARVDDKNDQSSESGAKLFWELGLEGHYAAQRLRLSKLSFREKLAWLEEAHNAILRMQADAERWANIPE
jgi:hypothetical protein